MEYVYIKGRNDVQAGKPVDRSWLTRMKSLIVCCLAALLLHAAVNAISIIRVDNGGEKGNWEGIAVCPEGSIAIGFAMKVQFEQILGDNTALNGVELHCHNSETLEDFYITSGEGIHGDWGGNLTCAKGHHLQSFRLRVQPPQDSGDDSAANSIQFKCSNGNTLAGIGMTYGEFGNWSDTCLNGICGLETRIEPDGGAFHDDTSLNDVEFLCC